MKKISDENIGTPINLWQKEPALWDSSSSVYRNADARKAAIVTCDVTNA